MFGNVTCSIKPCSKSWERNAVNSKTSVTSQKTMENLSRGNREYNSLILITLHIMPTIPYVRTTTKRKWRKIRWKNDELLIDHCILFIVCLNFDRLLTPHKNSFDVLSKNHAVLRSVTKHKMWKNFLKQGECDRSCPMDHSHFAGFFAFLCLFVVVCT